MKHKHYNVQFPDMPQITPRIRGAIETGNYERYEAKAALSLVKDGDSVLELGGGAGFMSTLLSTQKRLANCTIVEADPRMIEVISATHALNGVQSVNVIHAIATSNPASVAVGSAMFAMANNFTASSANKLGRGRKEASVPTISLQTLIDRCDPAVIICDIEGGEIDILGETNMNNVRAVIMEIHPYVIHASGVRTVFRQMHDRDLIYDAQNSFGNVISFTKSERNHADNFDPASLGLLGAMELAVRAQCHLDNGDVQTAYDTLSLLIEQALHELPKPTPHTELRPDSSAA